MSQQILECGLCGLPIVDEDWVYKIAIDNGKSIVVPVHVSELKG